MSGKKIIEGLCEAITYQNAYAEGYRAALEEAATFVEENYEEPFINIVGNQSWRERGPRKLAAAVRALKDHSPQQDSS